MGRLDYHNIGQLIEAHKLERFVETGSGRGDGIRHATQFPFKTIYSSEIVASQADHLKALFSDDSRVNIFSGASVPFLDLSLPILNTRGGAILFWLDAHYPGGDLGHNDYDYEKDLDLRLPLEKELEMIWRHRVRRGFRDVIICDDLRIYERGPYPAKNLDEIGLAHIAKYDAKFLHNFEKSHDVQRIYDDTGFVVMTPK